MMRTAYAKSSDLVSARLKLHMSQTIMEGTRVLWKESAHHLWTTFQYFAESCDCGKGDLKCGIHFAPSLSFRWYAFLYANFSSTCVQSPNIRSTQRLAWWPLAMYLRPWQVPGSILAASWWHVHYHSHPEFLWKSSDHRCGRNRKICVYKRRHVWWMGPKNTAWNACGRKSIPPSANNNAWNVYVWCRNLHSTNECTGRQQLVNTLYAW